MNPYPVAEAGLPAQIILRAGRPGDAAACGAICFQAFKTISGQHNFPADFPSVEVATGLIKSLLSRAEVRSTIAEVDGRISGSNFVWKHAPVAGIGPITVDPKAQNVAIGRRLMQHALEYTRETRFPAVRLVQAAYHNRSLSLYTKLGFVVREPLVTLQGRPLNFSFEGYGVRRAESADLETCNRLSIRVHGHARGIELRDAIRNGTATVVERDGRIAGYATLLGFFGHALAESNNDLKALIGAAPEFAGPGFLLPVRNTEIFRWCLDKGLRAVQPMTLMSQGMYNEPAGAFLPSILY